MAWVKCASVLMVLAIVLGAFGSHLLRGKISDVSLEVYKTAVLYHMIHALGLFIIAWASTISNDPKVNMAGILLLIGIILFSGSLYLLSVTGSKWLGAITPVGGLCFIAGWFVLILLK